jgi:mono/diheme cytochrome c family protein
MRRPGRVRTASAAWLASALATMGCLLVPGGASAEVEIPGQATYRAQCAMCHGEQGNGDGPAAAMLNPKPKDLGAADFWTGRTEGSVAEVVRQGKPDSAMMGYQSVLSAEQIRDVVTYLRSLSRP